MQTQIVRHKFTGTLQIGWVREEEGEGEEEEEEGEEEERVDWRLYKKEAFSAHLVDLLPVTSCGHNWTVALQDTALHCTAQKAGWQHTTRHKTQHITQCKTKQKQTTLNTVQQQTTQCKTRHNTRQQTTNDQKEETKLNWNTLYCIASSCFKMSGVIFVWPSEWSIWGKSGSSGNGHRSRYPSLSSSAIIIISISVGGRW